MRVGIVGGGQLARMLILAGKPLGLDFTVFTPQCSATTAELAEHIIGEMSDQVALTQLLDSVDVVTYENENIPVELINYLQQHSKYCPNLTALKVAQDRLQEKKLFQQLNISTNLFFPVNHADDLVIAATKLGFPFRLKSRRDGYDGKYQYHIQDQAALDRCCTDHDLSGYIAEEFINFDREVSMIATRDQQNNQVFYDLCENSHTDGMLRTTINLKNDPLYLVARDAVQRIMKTFDYVGTIAVEFFVIDGDLLANEIAPRVHNSGHWTIDACNTSQFNNHLRAITGMPLGDPSSLFQCTMHNIISEWPDREQLLKRKACSLHDYQKEAREGRKLGHVTCSLV